MFVYKTHDCLCLSAQDTSDYLAIINKTLRCIHTNITMDHAYVAFECADLKFRNIFRAHSFSDYDDSGLGNFLLYLYDMCQSQVVQLLDPYNPNKKKLPHMNAVKDVMYSLVNKLVSQQNLGIVHLIYDAVQKTSHSYLYDFYRDHTNYLFFKALLAWFNLDVTTSSLEVFQAIQTNHMSVVQFQDLLVLKSLSTLLNSLPQLSLQPGNDPQGDMDCFHVYKNVSLKAWFDNSYIQCQLTQLVDYQCLVDLERLK